MNQKQAHQILNALEVLGLLEDGICFHCHRKSNYDSRAWCYHCGGPYLQKLNSRPVLRSGFELGIYDFGSLEGEENGNLLSR